MARKKSSRAAIARRAAKAEQETSTAVGLCPACGKKAFTSKAAAKTAAAQIAPGVQLRFYRCPDDDRWWHQTSLDSGVVRQWRDNLVFRSGPIVVTEADAELAAQFVATVVQGTGEGPIWSRLAEVMDWPAWVMPALMSKLARDGWLEFTGEPRSLLPGRKITERNAS